MQISLDIVEAKDRILFVTGYVAESLSVGDELAKLSVYEPAKKQKQSPKRLSDVEVSLTVASIIVAGETLDTIQADTTAQIGLTGSADAVLRLLADHHWHERNGRYHVPRNETRIVMLSGE